MSARYRGYQAQLTDLDRELLALYEAPVPPPPADGLCCDGFRRGVFAVSIRDPLVCVRCWPARQAAIEARRYAWRHAPFGRIRRVPPRWAARWQAPIGRITRARGRAVEAA